MVAKFTTILKKLGMVADLYESAFYLVLREYFG